MRTWAKLVGDARRRGMARMYLGQHEEGGERRHILELDEAGEEAGPNRVGDAAVRAE